MEYAIFALAIFLMFSLIGVILYVSWIVRYGVEEYQVGNISIRKKLWLNLSSYKQELSYILSACKGNRFMSAEFVDAEKILNNTHIVIWKDLYAGDLKCIGLAKCVHFMNIPGDWTKRYIIFLDIDSIQEKKLTYNQIEELIRHEFKHHYLEYTTGNPFYHVV